MNKKMIDKTEVKRKVANALDAQFETYSWWDMLNDCDLTPRELTWAKEHLSYEVVEY
jgi:hypothetical protein